MMDTMNATGKRDKNGVMILADDTIIVRTYEMDWINEKYKSVFTEMIVKYVDQYASWCVFHPANYEAWKNGSNHFKYAYDSESGEIHFLGQLDSDEIEIKK